MSSSSFNPSATTFIPGNTCHQLLSNIDAFEESDKSIFEDAFMEYAYERGLWGIGGNGEPSPNDIMLMRQEFAHMWNEVDQTTAEQETTCVENTNISTPQANNSISSEYLSMLG